MLVAGSCWGWLKRAAVRVNSHLRIEEASGPLNNRNGLAVGVDGEDVVLAIPQHGNELKAKILWMQLGGEGVGNSLL